MIVPTGGGKTLTMIMDAKSSMDRCNSGVTTVVVAPRILLAEQLCSEFMEVIDPNNSDPYLHVLHVHSGETHSLAQLKQRKDSNFMLTVLALWARTLSSSPPTILCIVSWSADIEVNNIYFDEAHNSVKKNFFPATEFFQRTQIAHYSYTATPKHSLTPEETRDELVCLWSSSRQHSCT